MSAPLLRRYRVSYIETEVYAIDVNARSAAEAETIAEAVYLDQGYEAFAWVRGSTDVVSDIIRHREAGQ